MRTLIALVLVAIVAPSSFAQTMLFAGNGNGSDPVYRANLDGSNLQQVVTGLGGPQDIEVEPVGGKVYWTDSGKVQRANLDGTNVEDVVTGLTAPRGLAVDEANGHVYITSTVTDSIVRADTSSIPTAVTTTLVSGLNAPIDVRVDAAGGKLYWNDVNNSLIQSANLDGSGVTTIASVNGWSIEIDAAAQRIYYTTGGSIGFVSMAGGALQTLVTGLVSPDGLALDVAAGKIYWADRTADKVQRANLDGTNVEDLVANVGLDTILDVSLALPQGPCPAAWANYGVGVAGTSGIPALVSLNNPVIGQQITLNIGNSAPAATPALLVLGLAPAAIPGFWGGDLLVSSLIVQAFTLPAGGTLLSGIIPQDPTLCGASLYLQMIQSDGGAALGASSTRGLELKFGN